MNSRKQASEIMSSTTAVDTKPTQVTDAGPSPTTSGATSSRATSSGSKTTRANNQNGRAAGPKKANGGLEQIAHQLLHLAKDHPSSPQFYPVGFRHLCELAGAVYGSLDLRLGPTDIEDEFRGPRFDALGVELQLAVIDAVSLESQSEDRSIVRVYNAGAGTTKVAAISIPVHEENSGEQLGVIVFVVTAKSPQQVQQATKTLKQLVGYLSSISGNLSQSARPANDQQSHLLEASTRASQMDSIEHLAFAMTNSLCQKNGCSQVAFGRVSRSRVDVVAVSGLDRVVKKSPGIVALTQAMEECLDKRQPIVVQQPATDRNSLPSDNDLLHRKLHQDTGACVLSIPIMAGDSISAIVSMQRSADDPFTSADLQTAKTSVEPFGPSVELLYRAKMGLGQHVCQSLTNAVNSARKPKTLLGLLTRVSLAAALLWFVFGWMPFCMTVPCTIQPAQVRHMVAPFVGVLDEVHVRPGDKVATGDLLLKLDTRDLELSRDELKSQLRVTEIAMNRALSERDTAAAATARAELEVLDVQLSTVARRLRLAEIRAPFDAIVMNHDLSKQAGRMLELGQPLLELAPDNRWLAELTIPERFSAFVQEGQTGHFACVSKPSHQFDCKLTSVSPHINAIDGANAFAAEAHVNEQPDWMRPGMEGVAKVRVGWKPVFWVYLHRAWNAIRMRVMI